MNGKSYRPAVVILCAVLGYGVGWAQTLSGRVYEGQTGSEPPTAKAVEGVTVSLYGSNNSSDDGTGNLPIQTTTTNSEGWYSLTVRGAYDFYNIVQTNKAGYVDSDPSPAATSVGGTVKSSNWIQYRYEDIFVTPLTMTGNKFWDKQPAPTNRPPVAVDDSATTPQDTPVDVQVLANDSDPDGDPLHVNGATDPPHGTVANHGTHVTYTPDPGYTGTDTFDYTAGDGKGGTDTATVTVRVQPAPPEPSADLQVSLIRVSPTQEPVPPGSQVQYNIQVWQNGPSTARNVVVTVELGSKFSYDASYSVCTLIAHRPPNDVMRCQLGDLPTFPPGTLLWYQVNVDANACGPIVSTATISSDTPDPDLSNNTFSLSTIVGPCDDPSPERGMLDGYKRDADTGAGLANWRIFIDLNGNGQWDTGEPNDLTDSNGYYRIPDMEPGTYRVCEQMQAGWQGDHPCVDGVAILAGATTTQDFHNRRTDLPESQCDYGDAPASYGLAWHTVQGGLSMGTGLDIDATPKTSAAADGDDNDGFDDEDGMTLSAGLAAGKTVEICLVLPNGDSLDRDVAVAGWIDFDGNGQWNPSTEQIFIRTVHLPAKGYVKECVQVTVPQNAKPGTTFARFRLFGDIGQPGTAFAALPTGDGGIGEVEDYQLYILSDAPGPDDGLDFGDAPLPYPEASHLSGGPYLGLFGDAPDSESGMQRDGQAAGDDNDSKGDDENGLLSVNMVKTAGVWSTWEIKGYFNSSSDAKFGLWLDLNGDGDWDDSGELLSSFGFCGFGTGPQDWYHAMAAFLLPAGAKAGPTYMRLRVYDDCNATPSPSGTGGPGEVEDYRVEIKADGPGVPPGGIVHGYKWNDVNGNGLWDILNPVEPPLAGWTIWLDMNSSGKQDAGDMTTQTDAQGHFRFTGVPAGTYTLGEQLQSGWTQTTPGGAGTYSVTVQPGQGTFPQMFGNRQSGGSTSKGQICGSKWNDLNGNALMDPGEPYLSGWTVYLDLNHNGQLDPGEPNQLTDASGGFLFTGLAAGTYTVAEHMQAGWQQTWPGPAGVHVINIQPSGVQSACVMFGNQQGGGPGTNLRFDWGDAPDPTYPTLRASNGAYHVIVPGFHLGAAIDDEADGQPSPDALGDDASGADDEDGVIFLTPLLPDGTAELEITLSAAGLVDGWIDFDGDGSWGQPGEQILTSQSLTSGSHLLNVAVPASAPLDLPTYARFRLSRTNGLGPEGPAPMGEVEDYHVLIGPDGPSVPGDGQRSHVKWSQPPLETDPNVALPPVFCGWNEAARSTQYSGGRRQWRMDADDFHCLGPIPITRIRWWGGYKGWTESEPPELQPDAWHIGFWANQVEDLGPDKPYLERLVWAVEIPNERVAREPVGLGEFPECFSEMCFVYEVRLEPEEWFHQAEFTSNSGLFWISITAMYPEGAEAVNQWGWLTRPHVWRDGAIMPAIMGEWPTFDERLFPGRIYPIERSALCGQNQPYDLCFELLTEPPWIKWDQPFTGLRDWPHHEDMESQGTSILQQENLGRVLADDWLCEGSTPVVAVAWWGSYIGYGYETCRCQTELQPLKPDYFLLQVRAEQSGTPGEVIWEYRAFDYDEILVGSDRHPEGEPNEPVFRYTVRLPEENWFRPEEPGRTYWLSITAIYAAPLPMIAHPWGWTNHPHAFGNSVEFIDYRANSPPEWRVLVGPEAQPIDMSFTLFTVSEPPSPEETVEAAE